MAETSGSPTVGVECCVDDAGWLGFGAGGRRAKANLGMRFVTEMEELRRNAPALFLMPGEAVLDIPPLGAGIGESSRWGFSAEW